MSTITNESLKEYYKPLGNKAKEAETQISEHAGWLCWDVTACPDEVVTNHNKLCNCINNDYVDKQEFTHLHIPKNVQTLLEFDYIFSIQDKRRYKLFKGLFVVEQDCLMQKYGLDEHMMKYCSFLCSHETKDILYLIHN